MNSMFLEKEEQVKQLCAAYAVSQLELFGSAARTNGDVPCNDLDLLVRFRPCTPEEHAERYFGLLAALQDLFDCPIDLVESGAIRNPYFLEAIECTRTPIYAT